MIQKSIFTLLILAFLSSNSLAQPVLQNTVIPEIGDVVKLTEGDTVNVSQGNAGANQTWNFSNWHIQAGTQPVEYLYISPVGTPYAANYPTATMATKINQDTAVYAYFREQSNQYSLLGTQSLAFEVNFTDPDAQLKFPTNYNGSYPETFAYTTDAGTGVVFHSKGSRTTTYDAYGTLITPLGTFPNAMRLKAVSSQVDSAEFSGLEIVNQTFLTTYAWIAAGHPGTLASVYYINTISETRIPGIDTIFNQSPVTKSVNYISSSTVGVFEPAQKLSGISELNAGPNPASDQYMLWFKSDADQPNLQLRLSDAMGRLLHTQSVSVVAGENMISTSLAPFPAGNYVLSLTDGHGMQNLKVAKL